MFKRSCEVPFLLLIYLQRVCFSPPSQVSLLLQQNEVSKYISVSCTRSHFFCFPCFVLSYLFITAYIWHGCKCLFFFSSDFCSSNICFLCSKWGAEIAFHSVTKTFDILTSLLFETIRIEKISLKNKHAYYCCM